MSSWKNLLRPERRYDSKPAFQGTQPLTSNAILAAMGSSMGDTSVNENSIWTVSAVIRAISVLSSSIAGADKTIILSSTGKLVKGVRVISDPHPEMDEYIFWETAMVHLLTRGNFYAYISREKTGPITSLTPLNPDRVTVKAVYRDKQWVDTLFVFNDEAGREVGIPSDEMFHIVGLTQNGFEGMSVLEYGRRVIGNSLSADEFANKFYTNGSMSSGVLTTEKRLDENQAKALKERWKQRSTGLNNAFDIIVLDQGATFSAISLSPSDSQFLETRKFNVEEIARLFGVPVSILTGDGAGNVNVEQVSTLFLQFTLQGWTKRIAAAVRRQLLKPTQALVFRMDDLIKPDMRTRSSAGVMWRTAQIKSINELRAEEHLPPIDDPDADDPMFALAKDATTPGTNQGAQEQPVPAGQDPSAEPSQ